LVFGWTTSRRKPAARQPSEALCALNPSVKRRVIKSGGQKVGGVSQKTLESITYEVPAV
jgi:hypothetical protein